MQSASRRTLAIVAKKYRWTRKTVIVCTYMCRFLVHVQTVSNLSRRILQKYSVYFKHKAANTILTVNVSLKPCFLFSFFHFVDHLSDRLSFYAWFMNRAPRLVSQHSWIMSKHLRIYYYIPSNDSLDAHGTSLYISFTYHIKSSSTHGSSKSPKTKRPDRLDVEVTTCVASAMQLLSSEINATQFIHVVLSKRPRSLSPRRRIILLL